MTRFDQVNAAEEGGASTQACAPPLLESCEPPSEQALAILLEDETRVGMIMLATSLCYQK